MTVKWKSLQNGSDIRGVATDGVPGEAVDLSPDVVDRIAAAFVYWLAERKDCKPDGLTISVGRDSRISGPVLSRAFIEGVTGTGANAVNCGLVSTPAMFMSTIFEKTAYDGAVMLTASHLPFNRNGIKFFTREGGLDKPDISAILEMAAKENLRSKAYRGDLSTVDLISSYSRFLVDAIRKGVNHPTRYNTPLQGFHVIVDAGNGSGGFFVDQVLHPLGAVTTGSLFLDPDGRFPNHVPNPEDDAVMEFIRKAVLEYHADIGIVFDTDVDRAAAVDEKGTIVNRNRLIAWMSAIVLEEHPGTTIVTDSITSDGLARFISMDLKGIHHRFKRGYKNVINEAIRLNEAGRECWLAIETSGHAALRENWFLDDGAYLMTKILIKAARMRLSGQNLSRLAETLIMPAEGKEFRIRINTPDFISFGNRLINELGSFVRLVDGWSIVPNNHEGIRVACDAENGDGWFLLRLSLHDPVLPLNVESNRAGGIDIITRRLTDFFYQYPDLKANLKN